MISPEAAPDAAPPIIVTLAFDAPSFAHFDAMRRRHFPAKRNVIPAHLTLFHALPGDAEAAILDTLQSACAQVDGPLPLGVTALRFLGYGCAYVVASPPLERLRAGLATDFADCLTRQDAQRFQPHVTIQNKAPAPAAKALFAELDAAFEPFAANGTGLTAWRYLGGPWAEIATIDFGGSDRNAS